MNFQYDTENIFAKILRGEIPCSKVMETDHSFAFEDIAPAAPVHILVIPKGAYVNADHFHDQASDAEIVDFWRTVKEVAKAEGVSALSGGNGYRMISNIGDDGVQEVQHLHVHVIGGKSMGRMVQR